MACLPTSIRVTYNLRFLCDNVINFSAFFTAAHTVDIDEREMYTIIIYRLARFDLSPYT